MFEEYSQYQQRSQTLHLQYRDCNQIQKIMIVKERIQKADGTIKFRNYLKQDKLGKGGFADCYLAQRMQDKKQFALKIIPKKLLQKPKAKQKMLSEIKLHRTSKHKYICELQRAFQDEQNVYMILELCSNGNMFQMLKRRKKLTVPETQYFIYQLIDSLCYLHNHQIVHRDVKLGNILINSQMQLKLADFGLATKIQFPGDRKHTVCGTPNYIAPQVILYSMGMGHSGHSYQVDTWSTGVIMYLMLIGKAPFETNKLQHTYDRISKAQFDFPQSFKDEKAKDLLRRILVADPSKRYTFQQMLNHQFMNPKNGIPKTIPTSSINQVPKFAHYEKYQQNQVKQSARNASIMTLRSEVDLSMDEDFSGIQRTFRDKNEDTTGGSTRSKNGNIKGLIKSVFSTSSLSSSLSKLASIGRSTSPSGRLINGLQTSRNSLSKNTSQVMSSRNLTLRPSSSYVSTQSSQKRPENQLVKHPYVLDFKRQIVLSYIMNTGYIGTYQSNYKLLYNKNQKMYFEAQAQNPLKKVKTTSSSSNESIQNRKKFIQNFIKHPLQCQPSVSIARLVYVKKLFQVKSQHLLLFRFSNQNIQVCKYQTNQNLLITQDELILIQIKNGLQTNRIIQKKDDYAQSKNKNLIKLYLIFKKINAHIVNKKR